MHETGSLVINYQCPQLVRRAFLGACRKTAGLWAAKTASVLEDL